MNKIFFGIGTIAILTMFGYVFYDPSIFTHNISFDFAMLGTSFICFISGILLTDFEGE